MANKKFEKQKLNKADHKKADDTAKNVRNSVGALAVFAYVGVVAKKYGPKILEGVVKTITKL